MAEDLNGESGTVRSTLTLTGAPGELITVWEISSLEGGPTQYVDPADASLVLSVPCSAPVPEVATQSGQVPADSHAADDGIDLPTPIVEVGGVWPACIEAGVAFPSADGAGLFLNLGAFNITEGCFLNDCSYSDHYGCPSPAECARMCDTIAACRWWTFQELAPPTCWLRGAGVKTREEAPGYFSGGASCVPPQESRIEGKKLPTLFELVGGEVGVPASRLWGASDLFGTLEHFGNLTVPQLKRLPHSHTKYAALRVAAVAASKCAASWRGCD